MWSQIIILSYRGAPRCVADLTQLLFPIIKCTQCTMPKATLKLSDLSDKAKEKILKDLPHILKSEKDLNHVKSIEIMETHVGDSLIHIAKLDLFPQYVELTDKDVINAFTPTILA